MKLPSCRWLALVAPLFFAPLLGCGSSATPAPCKVSSDCPGGTMVCRGDKCSQVACNPMVQCGPGEVCDVGKGMCVPLPNPMGRPCKISVDCPVGQVCRAATCGKVPCGANMPCGKDETCVSGVCAPGGGGGPKVGPGTTLSAGGGVASSGKHIHIGITGQGRAVGPSTSGKRSHVGGATKPLHR